MVAFDPSELAESLRLAWENWATLNGEALSAKKKMDRTFAQVVISQGNIATSKASYIAEASGEYKTASEQWVDAETKANIAKGFKESLEVRIDLIRSLESSRREEIKRLGK